MPRVDQRRALAVLSRTLLLELMAAFDLDVDPSEPEHLLVDGLARSRKASFDRILARLEASELRKMLELGGVTPSTSDALELRALILGDDLEDAGGEAPQVNPRGRGGRGGAFEEAFRKHMLEDLGFRKVVRNEWVKGKVADRGYDCDLHGTRYPYHWVLLGRLGIVFFLVSILALVAPRNFQDLIILAEGIAQTISPRLAGSGLLVLAGGAWFMAMLGKKNSARHVWVECKNRKSSIKRTDILKLVNAVQDAAASPDRKWTPHEMWFASGRSSFDQDALNFAQEHNVRCLVWEGGKSKPVNGV